MILEFSLINFRSIRQRCTFSLIAESGQSKDDNYFEVSIANDQQLRLLRSAVIYGANASGKTNLIRGISSFIHMIRDSKTISVDEEIPYYHPFAFDLDFISAPTEMEIIFLMKGEDGKYVKYRYTFSFTASEIVSEELDFYPKGQPHNLFKRTSNSKNNPDAISHIGKLSKSLGYKEYVVFRNQLFLPKFGVDIPHNILTPIYLFFSEIEVWNTLDNNSIQRLQNRIAKDLLKTENTHLARRISKLLKIADTKIENVLIEPGAVNERVFNAGGTESRIYKTEAPAKILANHIVYQGTEAQGFRQLDLKEESAGTRILFALGGLILQKLEKGGCLFFDEMDNSLHPKLCRFLIRLFNSNIANPHNAQLVIATHEVTLLDKDVFRKDQIWFAQKDKFGKTEIFSAKEFEGVRDDTPFDRWYMNGKFGGDPKIKELEFIFDNG